MTSVLSGLRVLDLSWGVAGPITGMLLSDNGADVIKIEPPGGDPFRSSPGYAAWLRGRRSAELDLTDDADRETFLGLASSADIVLESFSPGTTERLGIDADALLAENPSLVYCSITGYGPHPGHRSRPGHDALVAARLGLLHEQRGHLGGAVPHIHREDPYLPDLPVPEGMESGSPRSGPIFTYTPWPSICAAYLATTGINAALLARLRTGRGQHVETSLLQAALSLTASKWIRAEHNDEPFCRTWIYDQRAPKGFFQCADDRWVEQWVPNPRFVLSSADGTNWPTGAKSAPCATIPIESVLLPRTSSCLPTTFPRWSTPSPASTATPGYGWPKRPVFLSNRCAPRKKPWPIRHCWPSRLWWTWTTPTSARSARSASCTA